MSTSIQMHRRHACLLAVVLGYAVVTGCNWNARTENAMGVRLYEQGNYMAAQQHFQQAIHSDPRSADAYYNMAAALHKSGMMNQQPAELKQAESYYHQCIDLSRNHRECYRGLAVLLVEQERSEEAFRLIENWAVANPTLADPKIELARLFQEFGDREAAREHLIEAIGVEPSNSRALAALGKIHDESGDYAQALIDYKRSLENNRFQPDVAARVAALSPAYGRVVPASSTIGNGTRTVNGTGPTFR